MFVIIEIIVISFRKTLTILNIIRIVVKMKLYPISPLFPQHFSFFTETQLHTKCRITAKNFRKQQQPRKIVVGGKNAMLCTI